ncbi:hypothetical protein HL455_08910 [Escherichia coli]|uniref:Glycosyl transferase n=6 Tax=Escherichia coli TaxID=562 RepID=B5L370_ECOLX|nr:hypothetical protein [Escherichia coli]EFN8596641.1 hypothetical protein [Escherichia coli O79:H40]EFN8703826.1 hypothetical protein [Escherichia coli O79]ACA24740.1 WbdU [Escherichia coli]AIG62649.1 glycosyl transferase [Escherichia coli]EEQ8254402.1 hypothetical protein [Escherichia coli]
MNNFVVIYVCYGDNFNYEIINAKIRRFLAPLDIKAIVIANTKEEYIYFYDENGRTIKKYSGLNSEMEFSGYFYGVEEYFERRNIKNMSQSYIFMNDTLFSHGKLRKIERLGLTEWKLRSLLFKIKNKEIHGFWHKSIYLRETELKKGYFNSKFFILHNWNFTEIKSILNLNGVVVTINDASHYENNIFMSDKYSRFLQRWLHESDGWYKAQELNCENKKNFLKKATSIVHEHYITKFIEENRIKKHCLINNSRLAKFVMKFIRLEY